MKSYTINDMTVGQTAQITTTVTADLIQQFANVTGDFNPVHLDEAFAQNTMFKGRIAHGMLSAGFISAVLGTELPGIGAIYLGQNLRFTAPVKLGDSVTAIVEVLEVDTEKNKVKMKTTCVNQDNVVLIEGDALLKPTKVAVK